MTKFKKLVMLCTALMMTASIAAFASCGDEGSSSSSDNNASTPVTDNSSDDSSSDNSSSPEDGGNEEPMVYYEEILAEGKGSLMGTAWTDSFGTLTLTIAEAGTYGIFTKENDVMFGAETITDPYSECNTNYTFNVTEAGEVTLTSYICPWSDGEVSYTYYLYKMNTLVIKEMTGEAELASNLRAPVTFVAPAAGTYFITADKELTWYNSAKKSDYGTYGYSFSITAEAAGEISFYVMLDNFDAVKLDFVWEITAINDVALTQGETTVDLYAGVYREVSFTATENGTYTLAVETDLYTIYTGIYGYDQQWDVMTWLECDYENFFNFSMTAGETKTIHIFYSGYTAEYDDGPTTIEVPVSLSVLQEANPSALVVGDNTFTATEEGVVATFTAQVAGTYSIDDGYVGTLWFDDTNPEWGADYSKEVTLKAGESITFTVKHAGLITISIEKMPDTISVNVGENTINLPAEMAYLNFANAEETATYAISFDGSKVVIMEDKGWMTSEIFADSEFVYNPYNNYTITTKTGEAIENFAITVTLVSNEQGGESDDNSGDNGETYAPMILGENAINVTVENNYCAGTNVTFTAIEEGTYVLSLADGEQNAEVCVLPDYTNVEFPYTFTLAAGESISFNVCTSATMTLTQDVIDLVLEKQGNSTPVEDKVDVKIDAENKITIGAGYYLTNNNALTLNGEYTFDWNVFVSNEETEDLNDTVAVADTFITVLVNGVEITSGTKLTYTEDTVVTITLQSSNNAQNVYVSLTVTKTPEQVKPDEEWTNNY